MSTPRQRACKHSWNSRGVCNWCGINIKQVVYEMEQSGEADRLREAVAAKAAKERDTE